jgi:hypothetical protein
MLSSIKKDMKVRWDYKSIPALGVEDVELSMPS